MWNTVKACITYYILSAALDEVFLSNNAKRLVLQQTAPIHTGKPMQTHWWQKLQVSMLAAHADGAESSYSMLVAWWHTDTNEHCQPVLCYCGRSANAKLEAEGQGRS